MTNAYRRHQIIDAIICDHTERNAELTRERLLYLTNRSLKDCGLPTIRPSALDRDIRIFRNDFGAPIKCNSIRGYYYSDPEYRRFETPPSEEILRAIIFTIGFLENFKNVPMISETRGLLRQLLSRLRCLDHHEAGDSWDFDIDFSFSPEGCDALEKLFTAHSKKSCVRVKCSGGDQFDLSPLGFSFGPKGFICRGYDALTEKMVEIPTETISNIHPANVTFVKQDLLHISDVRRN